MRSTMLSKTILPRSMSKPELFKTTGSWNFPLQTRLPQLSGGGIVSEINLNLKSYHERDFDT